jgi:integrase
MEKYRHGYPQSYIIHRSRACLLNGPSRHQCVVMVIRLRSVRFLTKFRTLPFQQLRHHKANPAMTDTSSTTVNRTLPRRLPNSAYRVREYLTEKEVDRLIEAARKRGRNGQRDATAILLAYRHGLRASELCSFRWSQIDLRNGRLHVNRAKGGIESVHPLHGPELRALRPLQGSSPYVFIYRSRDAGNTSLVPTDDQTSWRSCEASVSGSSAHAAALNWL